MSLSSKLPKVGTTIFTLMSRLARECNAINLSQGFPDFDPDEGLIELVHQHMLKGHNQYAPQRGVPLLLERIAEKMNQAYGLSIDPERQIVVHAGASEALFNFFAALVRPKDEVILFEPAFDVYQPAIELNGGRVRPYRLSKTNQYRVNWKAVEALVSDKTRLIVINTPHNPTGTCLKEEDLRSLEDLAQRKDLIVLSDEVYEHLVYDGYPHEHILKYPGLKDRSLAVFSFGKTFHHTGWKVGYAIGPEPLIRELDKVHQFNTFSVNAPVQYALADFLADPEQYQGLSSFYQSKRDFFLEQLQETPFRPLPCEGTYFLLAEYDQLSDFPDRIFAEKLTRDHGLATIPVSAFNHDGRDEQVVRFCFAKQESTLAAAGKCLRSLPSRLI